MSAADFVAPGRCRGCGRVSPIWTPDAITEAMRRWKDEHGHSPTSVDWLRAGPGHPNCTTVQTVFGKWGDGLKAAGLKTQTKRPFYWTKQRVADAFVEWRVRHGRWPTPRDWPHAGHDHPTASTVYQRFPNWGAALDYAGRARELLAA